MRNATFGDVLHVHETKKRVVNKLSRARRTDWISSLMLPGYFKLWFYLVITAHGKVKCYSFPSSRSLSSSCTSHPLFSCIPKSSRPFHSATPPPTSRAHPSDLPFAGWGSPWMNPLRNNCSPNALIIFSSTYRHKGGKFLKKPWCCIVGSITR